MQSILSQIMQLRQEKQVALDYSNTNHYRVVLIENDGSRTAYYFGAPIYRQQTGCLLNFGFARKHETVSFLGSNADITISRQITMSNSAGIFRLDVPLDGLHFSEKRLCNNHLSIFPATNGLAIQALANTNRPFVFQLESSEPFIAVWVNDRAFCFMREKHRPLLVVSCIGTLDHSGLVVSPASINQRKVNDYRHQLSIVPADDGSSVLFEINLYEPKLWQDTTVDSKNPTLNNAFGGTAFIGHSSFYGNQWLYARFDHTKAKELINKTIIQAVLHIPKFNNTKVPLEAIPLHTRFCSFGSNWNNKVNGSGNSLKVGHCDRYVSVDITTLLSDPSTNHWMQSEGLILRSKGSYDGYAVLSTGDNYYAPQILEINYK